MGLDDGGGSNIVKRLNVLGLIKGLTVCLALATGLSACGGAFSPQVFQQSFWAGGPTNDNTTAELGVYSFPRNCFLGFGITFVKS